MPETLTIVSQLEAIKQEWRKFPLLNASAKKVEDVIVNPQNYNVRNELDPQVTKLTEETQNGLHPLTSITFLYRLSQEDLGAQKLKSHDFLQVSFKLCSTIQTPNPSDFETHLSIIQAPVDQQGNLVNQLAVQYELVTKRSLVGTKIIPVSPVGRQKGKEIELLVGKLANTDSMQEPYRTTTYTWTGIPATLIHKDIPLAEV